MQLFDHANYTCMEQLPVELVNERCDMAFFSVVRIESLARLIQI